MYDAAISAAQQLLDSREDPRLNREPDPECEHDWDQIRWFANGLEQHECLRCRKTRFYHPDEEEIEQ